MITDAKQVIDFQCKATGVMDSADGAFFARETEHIKAKSYDKKYADLQFRTLIPISHDAPEGSDTVTVRSYDRVGVAKIISGYGTDLPRVDITGKEYSVKVRQFGESFGYTTKEIRTSRMTGKSLDQRRSNTADRASEELLNKIAWFGDSETGLLGLFTVGGIPTTTVATKAATGTIWIDNATPDEILFDMNNAVAVQRETTKMKESPTRMLLPVAQHQYIASTARSANSDTTILQYFLNNNQFIKEVLPVNELNGAGTGGVDVMVIYNPDPDNLTFEIPMELRHNPPQLKDLTWTIPCEGEVGGVMCYYPMSIAFWEGI